MTLLGGVSARSHDRGVASQAGAAQQRARGHARAGRDGAFLARRQRGRVQCA